MEEITIVAAQASDLDAVVLFLNPFMERRELIPRTVGELSKLIECAFLAKSDDGEVVAFGALEIYSRKLSEIQCLAVSTKFQRRGIGRKLVNRCVAAGRAAGVLEVMAISSSEQMFTACGFDYSLPNQKRAFFISPQDQDVTAEESTVDATEQTSDESSGSRE